MTATSSRPLEAPKRTIRRVRRVLIAESGDIAQVIDELDAITLLLDVEPFVCPWDTDDAALVQGLQRVVHSLEGITSLRQIIFITNSRRRPSSVPHTNNLGIRYISAAHKPFRNSHLLESGSLLHPVVVCGDQVLTDGILAWRLGGSFVQLSMPSSAPRWIRLQKRVGEIVAPLLFASSL